MGVAVSILYRGPLSSCNYECGYCPFAKHHESHEELEDDRARLARFVDWVQSRRTPTSIFFTPWGEALVRPWYHEEMTRLTSMPHVPRVAAQTNLSWNPARLDSCRLDRLSLWCTFHPSQTTHDQFLRRVTRLRDMGVRLSVGSVGMLEDIAAIESMRAALPADVYLWVNAYKRTPAYYSPEHLRRLAAVDPLFPLNLLRYRSLGRACRAGETVVSIDGNGDVRRCHFIRDTIGNIYHEPLESMLTPRPCSAHACGCHIGYVHMNDLDLYPLYGEDVLARIPARAVWHDPRFRAECERMVQQVVDRESADAAVLTIRGAAATTQVSLSGR